MAKLNSSTTLARSLALLTAPTYTGTESDDFLLAGWGSFSELTHDPIVVRGGAGNDFIVGGSSTGDALAGDAGNDVIYGDSLPLLEAFVKGGDDLLNGGKGDDKLYGQGGNDQLAGGDGNDQLFGGFGDDFLYDDQGQDVLNGGAGNDTYFYDSTSNGGVMVDLSKGVAYSDATGSNQLVSIENIVAGLGNDYLVGDSQANVIFGYGGADIIVGGAGSDTLAYGQASDSTVNAFDTVYGFDFGANGDKFQFADQAIDSVGTSSLTLNAGSNVSLGSALSLILRPSAIYGGGLEDNQAQLVIIEKGGLAEHYMVVDGNNLAGFQSDGDYVIQLVGALNMAAFGTSDFV